MQVSNLAVAEELVSESDEVDEYLWENGDLHVYFKEHALVRESFLDEMRDAGMKVSNIGIQADYVQFSH